MASQTIEVTVISAEELRVNGKVSVTVRTGPCSSLSTAADPAAAWNEKLVMELPATAPFLTVQVISGSRVIGAARIPVTDFKGGYLPENYLNILSYRLTTASGKKEGIVNLSVKVKGAANTGCAAACSRPSMGLPAADLMFSGGVAAGIPVPYTYI